jgi:hypothetical protein
MFLSAAFFAVLAAQGFAQPVVLTCANSPAGNSGEQDLTFDEAAGTAFWANQDPSSASFTDREITWKNRVDEPAFVREYNFTLSRMTGTLTIHEQCWIKAKGSICAPYSTGTWQCEASQKKF